jgi:hypothetical protein
MVYRIGCVWLFYLHVNMKAAVKECKCRAGASNEHKELWWGLKINRYRIQGTGTQREENITENSIDKEKKTKISHEMYRTQTTVTQSVRIRFKEKKKRYHIPFFKPV